MDRKATSAVSAKTINQFFRFAALTALAGVALWTSQASAQSLAAVNDADQSAVSDSEGLAPNLRRQVVDYRTSEAPGTIVVDTPNTYLYFVLGNGRAIRYGIGVGREGFTWSGTKTIERKTEWPDWIPPTEMLQRQPYLPRFMTGGPGNPLGARAMYLSGSVYRIHGTNAPSTIGSQVSSGCIRMVNTDVIDLYARTHIGTKVVVLPMSQDVIVHAPHVKPVVSSATVAAKPLRTSSL